MSKYGNKKTIVDGIPFDSKKEAARYQELRLLDEAGEIWGRANEMHKHNERIKEIQTRIDNLPPKGLHINDIGAFFIDGNLVAHIGRNQMGVINFISNAQCDIAYLLERLKATAARAELLEVCLKGDCQFCINVKDDEGKSCERYFDGRCKDGKCWVFDYERYAPKE